ncbi:hypothetical protein ASE01_16570 [Nocardioides sp. Root190]|uniref:hypothetical protein n=1 Tax=Nocardioides sp. Root190 TaxID=1736488 RepID=UPI0006FDFFE0|nr:hypothetical protein [Nocardioides sp. Root190]KRB74986.1 hypothetical protein ASE01_16570 [Nocardioides sp. Root190]
MELHDAIKDVVTRHGDAMLSDATGFRGVLDDVLEEDQASTGEINLLADAVRFEVLPALRSLISGGADPSRAVDEAGARLARERGGDDLVASSWAAAVLGYAVGVVPEAVVLRHRSQRGPTRMPPPTAGPTSPPRPPVQSPPQTAWPAQPAQPGPPTVLPGYGSAPQPGAQPGSQPAPYGSFQQYPSSQGYQPDPYRGAPPKKRRSPVIWVAAAVAGVVVVGGGIVGVVLATGGDDPGPDGPTKSSGSESPGVDVDLEAINSRYDALASDVTAGASDCAAGTPGTGQTEVVECTVSAGKLALVTYADAASLTAARTARLDYRSGTLTADNGTTALYEYDPERGGTSDPALVYWDSTNALQSATITGEGSVKIDSLTSLYTATSPRVAEPTAPADEVLREFIEINLDVATCTRQRTFFAGETEESSCKANVEGVVVNVGRYSTRKGMTDDRKYYKGKYDAAKKQGGGGTWKFGEGKAEGGYYAYLDEGTATLYWDWNKAECNCYGVAWSFDGNLSKLEKWWPSDEE